MINLIVAYSENYVIGKNNKLIWRLDQDLKRFKKITLNNIILMGRKTFQSLPKILPNRYHIVISKNFNFFSPYVLIHNSLHDVIQNFRGSLDKNIFIIGGGEIYYQSMPFIDKMYITKIHIEVKGDVFFPFFDKKEWNLVFSKFYKQDLGNEYNSTFLIYERKYKK